MVALPAHVLVHHGCDILNDVQTPEELKTPTGEEAFNADGLVQRSIRLLKDRFPDLEVGCASIMNMPVVAHVSCLAPDCSVPSAVC